MLPIGKLPLLFPIEIDFMSFFFDFGMSFFSLTPMHVAKWIDIKLVGHQLL